MKRETTQIAKHIILFLIVFLALSGVLSLYRTTDHIDTLPLNKVVVEVEQGNIKEILIEENRLVVTRNDGSKFFSRKESSESLTDIFSNFDIPKEKITAVDVQIKSTGSAQLWLGAILPFILPLVFIFGLFYFFFRQVQGSNNRALMFGQSRLRESGRHLTKIRTVFKDVAGVKEAKEELREVVEFLQSPRKFRNLGARIPKGVLLVGFPGTGKTLLARAVAGEANVPFYHISGSEFVEMFVGVGAARVRDLFRQAKKNSPCIVFIDEIDAVGRQRGAGLGGSHDEREQTLNQILVEMDGFEPDTNVIVIAATNRPDVLDPALLRPGRFDRRVMLDVPDIRDREEILRVHAKDKPLSHDVDFRKIAERTPGFTGADLANLLNEAAILAARRNKRKVGRSEILESIEKVLLGPERKSRVISDLEKRITAYHEAGHALTAHQLPHSDPVRKVTIVSRGQAGGYTLKMPIEDRHLHSRAEFIDNLAVMLGGYVAEKEIFHDTTTGASNDLFEATKLARKLVTDYGMSDLGPRTFGHKEELIFLGREISEQRDYSDQTADQIDKQVSKFLTRAFETATNVIRESHSKLEEIAKKLIEQETLEQEEFEAIFA